MIDDNYLSYSDSCMARSEGDSEKADYLFDTSWFQYYWRIVEHNRHMERVKKQMDEVKSKSK